MAGSSLAGNVAALATRQLAGVALGALYADLEADLTERTAVDVLRIRPAELPPGLSLGDFGTLARGTQIEYWRNNQRLVQFTDDEPYRKGWFALRTTQSHLRVEGFRVYALR